MKIMLVEPDDRGIFGLNFNGLFVLEPMSLELLAAAIPEYEVSIVDLRQDSIPLEEHIRCFKPDLVGVTGITATHYQMEKIMSVAKKAGAFTVAGGPHASFAWQDLTNADAVVIGEGEGPFRDLVIALDRGRDLNSVPNLVWHSENGWRQSRSAQYDLWPFPRRSFAGEYKYQVFSQEVCMVESTRGCPHRCIFCVTPRLFGGRYRTRPLSDIVDYIAGRPEPFVMLSDADFMASPRYITTLLDRIRKAGIKKRFSISLRADEIVANPDLIHQWCEAGLVFAFVGFEGYKQGQHDGYQKDNRVENNEKALAILHRHTIISVGTFIVEPSWGKPEFDECLRHAKRLGSDLTFFTVLTPFPGSMLEGREEITATYDKFDLLHAVTRTKLPYDEFQRNLGRISRAVLLSKSMPRFLLKLLKRDVLRLTIVIPVLKLLNYISRIDRGVSER